MEKGTSSPSPQPADPLDGLKFGKKIYFEGMGSGLPPKPVRSSSPAKRGRTGLARCQVEGCHVDLSGAKAYYSRHKVCGMHSKSSAVIVAGLRQRFCQQCSRFHQLPEFDQGKRSCRRRLAGHNERRRKPQTGSSFSSMYGSLWPPIFGKTPSATAYLSDHQIKTGSPGMDFGAFPWLNSATTREQELGGSTHLTQNHPLSGLLTSELDLSISGVSSEELLSGAMDSGGALSLLSNLESGFLGLNLARPEVLGCVPWSFGVRNDAEGLQMSPEIGLGRPPIVANGGYSGELALGQPSGLQLSEIDHSRAYDTSVHWLL